MVSTRVNPSHSLGLHLNKLNRERETKAFSAVRVLPVTVYVIKVTRETRNGAAVQLKLLTALR